MIDAASEFCLQNPKVEANSSTLPRKSRDQLIEIVSLRVSRKFCDAANREMFSANSSRPRVYFYRGSSSDFNEIEPKQFSHRLHYRNSSSGDKSRDSSRRTSPEPLKQNENSDKHSGNASASLGIPITPRLPRIMSAMTQKHRQPVLMA